MAGHEQSTRNQTSEWSTKNLIEVKTFEMMIYFGHKDLTFERITMYRNKIEGISEFIYMYYMCIYVCYMFSTPVPELHV